MESVEICKNNLEKALEEANKLISSQHNENEMLQAIVGDAQKKLFALRQEVDALKQYIGNQAINQAYSWGQDYLDRTLHENSVRIEP